MGLWIAILITLAVMGSILWIKPSPRERLLIEYRKAALSKGFKVRLLDAKMSKQLFPWIENYRQFVFYEKSLPVRAKPKSHKALVVRVSVDPNAHEIDAIDPIRQALAANLSFKELPQTVEAIVISVSGISILWRECSDKREGDLNPIDLIDRFFIESIAHSKLWT
mgnify:CR=1 FL=1|tara:strand:- start:1313 stop:1810 length:498 start_codon:yes stop_codon:yes gene_type:complete